MSGRTAAVQLRNTGRHADLIIAEALVWLELAHDKVKKDLIAAVGNTKADVMALQVGPDLRELTITDVHAALGAPNDFGVSYWAVSLTYSAPVPLGGFAGVRRFVADPASTAEPDRGFSAYDPAGGLGQTVVAAAAMPTARTITITLCPESSKGVYNSAKGVSTTISLGPVTAETLGAEWSDNVTGFSVTKGTIERDSNGVYRQPLTPVFTEPTDPRWAGIQLVAKVGPGNYVPLAEVSETGQTFTVSPPSTVQTWRIFARSFDQRKKYNSLNEGPSGTLTPYDDVSLGSNSGTLDAGKLDQAKLASYLEIAAGVLGIRERGLTAEMVAEYVLTGHEIADLAINRAAIIGLGIITEAHISSLAVFDAFIQHLAVDRIVGWSGATIDVGTGLKLTGGGLNMDNGSIHEVETLAFKTSGIGGLAAPSSSGVIPVCGMLKAVGAGSGFGTDVGGTAIDAYGNVSSANGVSKTVSNPTSITIVNGIVTACS